MTAEARFSPSTQAQPHLAGAPSRPRMTPFDTVRTSARRVLTRLGLAKPAFDVWRFVREAGPGLLIRNWRARRSSEAAALPVPPAQLIYSVSGTRDVQHFLESGRISVSSIQIALTRVARPIESFSAVLDMGCGCGRVLRHWRGIQGPALFGTDYNPDSIGWVRGNLPFVTAAVNRHEPPLAYDAGSFDLVYSISVLTHLREDLQRPWIEEMHRVIRPGGLLILTLCGTGMLSRLVASERRRFDSGELVVIDPEFSGSNICTVYHPDAYVHGSWSAGFRVLDRSPHFPREPYQDQWILQRI